MTVWNVLGWFFRSATGIAGAAVSALAAAIVIGSGFGIFPAVALGFTLLSLSFFASLATRNGLKSLIFRKDQDQIDLVRERLAKAAHARTSMAALRLSDADMAAARDRLVLEAGKFLEDSTRRLDEAGSRQFPKRGAESMNGVIAENAESLPLYDPGAIEAILSARTVLDAILHELDETATERRFGAEDIHPVDNPVNRTIAILGEKTRDILSGRDRILGIPDLSVRLEIEEELK